MSAPAVTAPGPPGPGLVNIANVLTVVRILLVPVFVACLFAGGTGWRLVALAAFVVASLTDFIDGWLARRRGLVTDFGKIADPIADKALTGAALISLTALGELPGWVTALILTLLQIAAICLYILPPELSPPAVVREVVMAVAVVVTLVTGADYVLRAVRLYRAPAYGQDGGGADG